MAFQEFYCDPVNGNNLYAGSDSGLPSMTDTAGTGSWTSTTQVYVSTATTGSVTLGQWLSLYTGSPTTPTTVARITNVTGGGGSAWTITVSNTSYFGTQPSSLTTGATYKAYVGGAWKGPNGATAFPFGSIANTATDASGSYPRVNLKNNGTYSITATLTHGNVGPIKFQGYTSSPGDGGKFILDGGTLGASYNLISITGQGNHISDCILQNNGASGNANGLNSTANFLTVSRTVVHNIMGSGISVVGPSLVVECEAYTCNISNTASAGGFAASTNSTATFIRCYAHDNTGTNNCGFGLGGGAGYIGFDSCIADSNGLHGFSVGNNDGPIIVLNCDAYNNGGDGFRFDCSSTFQYVLRMESCNFIKNTGYGVNASSTGGLKNGSIRNCGFGSGTQVNGSGSINATNLGPAIELVNAVTYASGVTPWVSPTTGNFSINLAAAIAAGRGSFTQTGNNKSGTIAYIDIGAAQHQDTAQYGGSYPGTQTREFQFGSVEGDADDGLVCTVTGSPTTTTIQGAAVGSPALSASSSFYNGSVMVFVSGVNQDICRKISSYNGATTTFSFSGSAGTADAAWPTAPAAGDVFMILGRMA